MILRFFVTLFTLIIANGCNTSKKNVNSKFFVKDSIKPSLYHMNTWKDKDDKLNSSPRRGIAEWEKANALVVAFPFDLPDTLLKIISKNSKLVVCLQDEHLKNELIDKIQEKQLNIENIKVITNKKCSLSIQDLFPFETRDSYRFFELYGKNNCIKQKKYSENTIKTKAILSSNSLIFDSLSTIYCDINAFNQNKNNRSLDEFRKVILYEFGVTQLIYFSVFEGNTIDNYIKSIGPNRILIKNYTYNNAEILKMEMNSKIFKLDSNLKVETIDEFKEGVSETSYMNSLIYNDFVFVPLYNNIKTDSTALNRWKELMPNHTIIGCKLNIGQRLWSKGDILSNRTKIIHSNNFNLTYDSDFRLR